MWSSRGNTTIGTGAIAGEYGSGSRIEGDRILGDSGGTSRRQGTTLLGDTRVSVVV